MRVLFDKEYLGNLYEKGDSGDKKHRFQPQVVKKYKRVVDLMIDNGLVNEVKTLHELGVKDDAQCMQAIGYKEICKYLNNETTLEQAILDIKQNSRNYAKRQITWFKKIANVKWLDGLDKIQNNVNIIMEEVY